MSEENTDDVIKELQQYGPVPEKLKHDPCIVPIMKHTHDLMKRIATLRMEMDLAIQEIEQGFTNTAKERLKRALNIDYKYDEL